MKVAIVKLSAMGDIIHAMVALQYIKEENPLLQIDWIVEQGFAKVLEGNPHIDNILPFNLKAIKKDKKELFRQIKLVKEYAKNGYDLVIDAQGLLKSAIVSKLLGKNRAGFSKDSIREGIASYFYTQKVNIAYEKNAIERNIKVLTEPLGITVTQDQILNKEAFLYFDTYNELPIKIDNYILFVVGASKVNKIYPKENFLEVAQDLNKKILVVWVNEYEKEVALYLEQAQDTVVVCPKLDLNELKRVISNAKLVIGGDTGPTHMAWAFNIPSITIFGNTPEYRNTYITSINKVIKSDSTVDPLKLDKNDFSIQEIDAQEIVTIAKELLDG